ARCRDGPLRADPDDDPRGGFWRPADRPRIRRRRRLAPTAGLSHRRRAGGLPVYYAFYNAGQLSLSRAGPGKGLRPHLVLPLGPPGRAKRRAAGEGHNAAASALTGLRSHEVEGRPKRSFGFHPSTFALIEGN